MSATFDTLSGLGIPTHDYEVMTYTGPGSLETVTCKRGGASGVVVAVITLTYGLTGALETVTRT